MELDDILRGYLQGVFIDMGISEIWAKDLAHWVLLLVLLAVAMLCNKLCHRIFRPVVKKIVNKTSTKIDDYLLNDDMLHAMCRVVPPLVFLAFLSMCFDTEEKTLPLYIWLERITRIFVTTAVMGVANHFLTGVGVLSGKHHKLQNHYIIGLTQFAKLIVSSLGVIVIISIIIDKSPINLVAGLGAVATVLMLVFKDSILGLVAGIQLSINDMLKPGDWITVKNLNVDGYVEKVSLTTVKVRNFDNTISTIPPYTLVSDSFQNWKAISKRGRRMKRVLYIDVDTVHFCTNEELDALCARGLATRNEKEKQKREVNLSLFRRYVKSGLMANPMVRHDDWVLIRQLEHTPTGLPIELYFYFAERDFVKFEELAADTYEQIVATLPEFGLRLFQSPTGKNLEKRIELM